MKLQICALGIALLATITVSAQSRGNGDIGSHDGSGSSRNGMDTSGSINVNTGNLQLGLQIKGQGKYVCSAENSFKNIPVLGRGQTLREAQVVAIQECKNKSGKDAFFCNVIECETDKSNDRLSVAFDIVRNQGSVNINYRGKASFACYGTGFGNDVYVAKAPTKTEALALLKSTCAEDEVAGTDKEPNGFFCRTSRQDCEKIGGAKAKIGVRNILDIF